MMEKNHENIWIKKHNTQQFVEIDPILIDIYIYTKIQKIQQSIN